MKLSSIAPYRWVATIYIEIFRGLPGAGDDLPGRASGSRSRSRSAGATSRRSRVGLGLVAAAYLAETLRAGIEGVPKGQMEAARSLGMTHTRAMASIIIPQGFRLVIPPLTNELVLLIKDTSLVFIIGTTLASRGADQVRHRRAHRTNPTRLIVISVALPALTVPMTQRVAVLERRTPAAR